MKGARKLRRAVDQALAKLHDRKPAPAPADDEPKPEPKSGALSHEKLASSKAVRYQPHRAKGSAFRDTRGNVNVVTDSGAVRTQKPPSRVKRERMVRSLGLPVKRNRKHKEADQKKNPPGSN